MSDRDPLLAILRGLHDALAQLADTTHWAAERARESLAEVDRLLREQEQADEPDDDGPYPDRRCTGF
ncbi:MAG: hypothetical protein IRZ07_00610 [Microbispora sp.]|nr:hypothetical protein [Microbispora sp.]